MIRSALALALLLALCPPSAWPQASVKPTAATVAGARVGAVPDPLYSHLQLPNFQRGQGVLVEQVRADSPAARAGLKRHDILLSYGGTALHDAAQFFRLVQTAPDKKLPLLLIRGGQELNLNVCLAAKPSFVGPPVPRGLIKPGGPPAVTVQAEALDGDKMRITFTFYSDGKGKLDRVTCSGSLNEIQQQVRTLGANQELPPRVQDLVDVALKRIRDLNAP